MSKSSAQARRELTEATRKHYLASSPPEKRKILDEFVALTGYHRKHAIRVLRASRPEPVSTSRRPRVYGEAVREALVVLWEASNRICGKRLKPLLPVLVPALESHGHLSLDEDVRSRVLAASPATIDRLLADHRTAAPVRARTRHARSPAARRTPAPALAGGEPTQPGYLRFDVIAHGGDHVAGSVARTLVLTDLASGWTECVALPAGDGKLVAEALERLRPMLPFRLRGIASARRGELTDDAVLAYCGRHRIEVTRSRPDREDERAWDARPNGSVVRRLVGRGRLEGQRAVDALERLYTTSRLYLNFLQPSFRLADKQLVGARVRRWHRSPETPCARLLASPAVDEATKQQLRAVLGTLDPRRLLDELRAARHHLAGLSAGEPPRHWRTRADPFEEVWPRVVTWLEREPDRTARELLQRLRDEGLGEFPDPQLRTLQRRVKAWRRAIGPARSP